MQQIIQEVLKRRKYQFTKESILEVIKQKMEQSQIDTMAIDCVYFQVLFLNTLENLVDSDMLYQLDNIYIPTLYMAIRDYHTNFSDLLYLDNQENWDCINVETLEYVSTYRPRDFILTGGFIDKEKQMVACPEVPLEEITSLYQDFVKEGASKGEAINLILNYYKIQAMPPIDGLVNMVKIQKKRQNIKRKVLALDN